MENLNQLGVQKMNRYEMQSNVNGGGLLLAAIGLYLTVEIVGNPKAHAEAFKAGMDAAK